MADRILSPCSAGKQGYTYLIGWFGATRDEDRLYYGYRSLKPGARPEDDLWRRYFTSSKIVKAYRVEHGEPDLIEINRRFECAKQALAYEQWYLEVVADIRSDRWLNQSIGGNKFDMTGVKRSAESVQRSADWRRGRKRSEETRKKISENRRGTRHTEEFKRLMSEIHGGKKYREYGPISEAHKAKNRAAQLGKPKSNESIAKREATKAAKRLISQAEYRLNSYDLFDQ